MATSDIPKRFPLVVTPENRNSASTKDAHLINGYLEKMPDGSYSIYKRFGLGPLVQYSVIAAQGRGIYNWLGDIYAIVGAILYKNGVNIGTLTAPGLLFWFSSDLGATPQLAFGDGITSYRYDTINGLHTMGTGATPPTFPPGITGQGNNFVSGFCYIDGTMYYGLSSTGTNPATTSTIFGSQLNSLDQWDAANAIVAQIEPDKLTAIAKHLVYLIAFKQWTTEVFYDAGNPTGSPLAPVEGAKMNYGSVNGNSVLDIDGELFWLTLTRNGAVQVARLRNLSAEIISTPAIERLFNDGTFAVVYAWCFKGAGHTFYIVTVKDLNLTLAYDVGQGIWSQWTDTNGNYLPIVSATFSGNLNLLLHETNGKVYEMSEDYVLDDTSSITFDLYTPNFDGGVDRKKMLSILHVNGDKTIGSTLQIRCNDFDYDSTKWTQFRNVDMGRARPILTNCGTFYRRAYHLRHVSPTPLRLTALDMQLDLGTL